MTLSTLVLLLVPSAYARTVAEPGARVGCSGEPQYATPQLGPFTDADDEPAADPPPREEWEKRYCSSSTLAGASLVAPLVAAGLSGGLVLLSANNNGPWGLGILGIGAGGLMLEAAPFLGAGFSLSSARAVEAGGGSVSRTPAVLGIVLGSTSVVCTGMAVRSPGPGEAAAWVWRGSRVQPRGAGGGRGADRCQCAGLPEDSAGVGAGPAC